MPELPPEASCSSFRCLPFRKNRDATQATPQTSRRQTADLMAEYPGCEAIAEIGSGLNFRRRRFLAMLERVIPPMVYQRCIVVAHQDRLVRFGVDFVEWLCRQFGWQIVVLDRQYRGWEAELIADLKKIFGRFSGRLRGLGKYEKQLRQEFPAFDVFGMQRRQPTIPSGRTAKTRKASLRHRRGNQCDRLWED